MYRIAATYEENGTELVANRDYAMGQYADQVWATSEDAEEIADELREDVGSVVHASVRYYVEEC